MPPGTMLKVTSSEKEAKTGDARMWEGSEREAAAFLCVYTQTHAHTHQTPKVFIVSPSPKGTQNVKRNA